jgi:hypothetical protein
MCRCQLQSVWHCCLLLPALALLPVFVVCAGAASAQQTSVNAH